ncbi:MAG: DNA polymerase III subunit delta [Patescibacteria group bacterium]|jgi:DNA polymerase-3 subunit delta
MIILLQGPDTFRSRQRLKVLRDAFQTKHDATGINIVRLDGPTLTVDEVNNAMSTRGFLSSKRMVIIENLSQHKSPKTVEAIQKLLQHWNNDDTVLVLWEGTIPSKSRKKKSAGLNVGQGKDVLTEDFPLLSGTQAAQWVKKEVARRGGMIETEAERLLISLVGNDLWEANSEIDKLTSYTKGRPITTADVELMVKSKFDSDIFRLTDALAGRQTNEALWLMEEEVGGGLPVPYLLTMLARQFRILLQVKDYLDAGNAPGRLATELELHPFVARKSAEQARRFSLAELKHIYSRLARLDQRTKSTAIDPRVLFDVFTVEAMSKS